MENDSKANMFCRLLKEKDRFVVRLKDGYVAVVVGKEELQGGDYSVCKTFTPIGPGGGV